LLAIAGRPALETPRILELERKKVRPALGKGQTGPNKFNALAPIIT
jgi:hypothetical protein